MRNVALIEQVMQQIKDHPELHDQGPFFSQKECGTAACFGGWACLLSGYEIVHTLVRSPTGQLMNPWDTARELLGLSPIESTTLFSPGNNRDMLERMTKDLINGDDMMPWEDYASDNLY